MYRIGKQVFGQPTIGLAHQSLGPVSLDGVSDSSAGHKHHSPRTPTQRSQNQHHMCSAISNSFLEKPLNLLPRSQREVSPGHYSSTLARYGQSDPSPGATAGQDLPSAAGAHAPPETMHAPPPPIVRLKCPLHFRILLYLTTTRGIPPVVEPSTLISASVLRFEPPTLIGIPPGRLIKGKPICMGCSSTAPYSYIVSDQDSPISLSPSTRKFARSRREPHDRT